MVYKRNCHLSLAAVTILSPVTLSFIAKTAVNCLKLACIAIHVFNSFSSSGQVMLVCKTGHGVTCNHWQRITQEHQIKAANPKYKNQHYQLHEILEDKVCIKYILTTNGVGVILEKRYTGTPWLANTLLVLWAKLQNIFLACDYFISQLP